MYDTLNTAFFYEIDAFLSFQNIQDDIYQTRYDDDVAPLHFLFRRGVFYVYLPFHVHKKRVLFFFYFFFYLLAYLFRILKKIL